MNLKLLEHKKISGADVSDSLSTGQLDDIFSKKELIKIAYVARQYYDGDLSIGLSIEEGGVIWFRYNVEYINDRYIFIPTEIAVPSNLEEKDAPSHYMCGSFVWGLVQYGDSVDSLH